MEKLVTGVAYHGNRLLRHVDEDMADIVRHGMNTVVHMFSHNDWDRHLGVMKEIVNISEYYGLDVWIDNWGIGGPPGDKSHFLQYHPESHQIFSDGSVDPVSACYNSEPFVKFTMDWLDTVREFGGKTVIWDEPRFKEKKQAWQMQAGEEAPAFTCFCDSCQKLFAEKYNKPMPKIITPELAEFRNWTLTNFFDRVTTYAHSLGMKNVICVMPRTFDYTMDILKLPHIDNFGIDPYWHPGHPIRALDPYDYVYTSTKRLLEQTTKYGKEHTLWIQGYDIPAGYEDELIVATDAAYDAGARSIFTWSYRGGESNTYKSEKCEKVWHVIGEAMNRVRQRHFDNIRDEYRKKYNI